MAIKVRLGRRRRRDRGGGSERDALGIGIAIAVIGLFFALIAGREGYDDLLVIALVMVASGVWIGGLYRVVARPPGLTIAGGLIAGWSLVGGIAAAYHRQRYLALFLATPLYVGLLLLGVLPVPGWARRPLGVLRKIWPGLVFMLAGVGITLQGIAVGPSEGVPPFVAFGAAGAFFLGGVLLTLHLLDAGDTILYRTLVALLLTGLGAVGVIFPPSLLFLAPIVVLSWIAVARLVVERATGRDPLAGWSQERVLALGCGVTLLLGLALVGVVWLESCSRPPEAPLPLEAEPGARIPE